MLLPFTLMHATWLYSDPVHIILLIHKTLTVIFSTVIFLLRFCNQLSANELWTVYADIFIYFDAFMEVCIAKLNNYFERKWMETALALFGSPSHYLPGRMTEEFSVTSRHALQL
jgi:hypothetical protein